MLDCCFLSAFVPLTPPFPFFPSHPSSSSSSFLSHLINTVHFLSRPFVPLFCFLISSKSSTLCIPTEIPPPPSSSSSSSASSSSTMERESNMFNANDRNCRLYRPNWENSMDQNDPFESALSSMVSSPTASNNNINGENIVLRELIGRLGSICNSGEISPFNGNNNNNSANTSCYSTPLNSPPKLNLSSMMERGNLFLSHHPTLPPLSADPAFAERAAKFSCFGSQPPTTIEEENADSRENSTVSDAIANPRKRKSSAPKAPAPNPAAAKDAANQGEKSESSGKRSKSEEDNAKAKNGKKQSKDNEHEAPKDYIHVRARRGQATDAHSLAERVRREKIGERMKVLQDLVPGCNKVTGKAVMLDEIINYVQSLQRQVEFLSMKLATVNPRTDFNMEAIISKDMFHSRGSLPHNVYSSDGYPVQSRSNQGIPMDNFGDDASQVSSFWDNDLHSIVNMGFGQGHTQNFEGIVPAAQMKVEL